MSPASSISLDASAISAFTASLEKLPVEEVRKAKSLFIRNAIADYRMALKTSKSFLIVLGVMSLIPLFLIIFIPAFFSYRAGKENGRQKILNALEVWRTDLGSDYELLLSQLD